MIDNIEQFLIANGPCLSSKLAEHLVSKGKILPVAARKRISRAVKAGNVNRLLYVTFPHKARFIYLQNQFASEEFWKNLNESLLETNSAYGRAISAIRQRGDFIPMEHFTIACGSPLELKRHLSPDNIFKGLEHAGLLQKTSIHGFGECISLIHLDEYYELLATDLRARLITEDILLLTIKEWAKNLGIVSYDKVKIRKRGNSPPAVGKFAWDMTAPCYLNWMLKFDRDGNAKPGFFACDIYLGKTVSLAGIKPFIYKCDTVRSLRNVGKCMQIFVANDYSHDAFMLLKKKGIIPARPSSLFGYDVAEGLTVLHRVLHKAAQAAIDPNAFELLFSKLGQIEGASYQLRGTLFEYLVADIVRKTTVTSDIKMNQLIKLDDGREAEADVIATNAYKSVTFIECKGYNPDAEIPDKHMTKWLRNSIPIIFKKANNLSEWRNLEINFEFWSTGLLSKDALTMFDSYNNKINPNRYNIKLYQGSDILSICGTTNDKGLINAFNKHFMKNY